MTYKRAVWEALRTLPLWKVLGFLMFDVLGVSISTVGPALAFFQGLNVRYLYLLWLCVLILTASGIFWIGQAAWTCVEDERQRLAARLVPQLDIIFDPDCQSCVWDTSEGRLRWLRVGVRNLGAETIDEVRVDLVSLEGVQSLPSMLRWMDDRSPSGLPLTLNPTPPDQHYHVDVLARRGRNLFLQVNLARGVEQIVSWGDAPRELVISASGRNVPPCSKRFRVEFDALDRPMLLDVSAGSVNGADKAPAR